METLNNDVARSEQATIDAILDAALEELDDESDDDDGGNEVGSDVDTVDLVKSVSQTSSQILTGENMKVVYGPEKPPKQQVDAVYSPEKLPEDALHDPEIMLLKMMDEFMKSPMPHFDQEQTPNEKELLEKMFHEIQTQLETELGSGTSSMRSHSEPFRQKTTTKQTTKSNKEKKPNVAEAIANIVDEMSQPTCNPAHSEPSLNSPDNPGLDNMFNGIFQGIQDEIRDGKFDTSSVLDGMMEQLLSKDLMYEPIKQVATKFPQWLEEHKTVLSPDEYSERSKQFESCQELVNLYETDPTNIQKLMECMQKIQEFGQPPVEIIKEIAPGIDLDNGGMPVFDSESELPPFFTGGGKDEECTIM